MKTIGDWYDEQRRKAATLEGQLAAAKKDGADYETLRRLERELEQARNTGD